MKRKQISLFFFSCEIFLNSTISKEAARAQEMQQEIVLCSYKSSGSSLLSRAPVYHAANALRLLQEKVKAEDCLPLPDRKGCLSTSDWAPAALAFRTDRGWEYIYKLSSLLAPWGEHTPQLKHEQVAAKHLPSWKLLLRGKVVKSKQKGI